MVHLYAMKNIRNAMSSVIQWMTKKITKSFHSTELDGRALSHWNLNEKDWKQILSFHEYRILRQKKTELPNSSKLNWHFPDSGYYACKGCGNPLYSYKTKFRSGCGWPAFGSFIDGSILTRSDFSFGMNRTEIICSKCDGHLGHVFKEKHGTAHDERHCVNGISLKYVNAPIPFKANVRKTLLSN